MYSWDIGGNPLEDVLKLTWSENDKGEPIDEESGAFARMLIAGTVEHQAEIDEHITKHLSGWTFDRVNKVSLAILRMSVYSLLYQKDMPASIVIDEAVDIAKDYGQDDSFKFINAVLDNIKKSAEN